MDEKRLFEPPEDYKKNAYVSSFEQYKEMYDRSIDDADSFWSEIADQFWWQKKWDKVREYDFERDISIKWFINGKTNVCYNALDRHLPERKDQVAYYWEGNEPGEEKTITYGQLHEEVSRLANVLKEKGVKKGDRVSIYMPMVPELAVSLLACARIGAIHSVVFGGFSAEALKDRIVDSGCTFLITTDGTFRGKKAIPLKSNADKAMDLAAAGGVEIKTCLVVRRVGSERGIDAPMKEGRDFWYHDMVAAASPECPVEIMDAEDPLFILYTSGSTGKPKGVQHNVGGYMVYTATTFKYVFDYHEGDVFWCTADIGWVTGHSYIVYGPLCNGATQVMFEGVPTYPDAGRFWAVVDKYKVNQFYTAPTAIRALMGQGDEWVEKYDLSSLKLLGSVGEPINPEAWMWYHTKVGHGRCPIVDTWWQTETGGILITPLPGAVTLKPGAATFPFFGVRPKVIRENGEESDVNEGGYLVISEPWPGMMRTVYKNHPRFKETYFSMYKGQYFTGDGARKDEDGYYWLMGRVDDVINVSGHRIGTAEVESALVSHELVAEAAVVGMPHDVKGQGIYAYVTLKKGVDKSDELKKTLIQHVRKEIGPIATPDKLQFADSLPKTRSGKIMRRILRKIAEGAIDSLGDTSTLADPGVVDKLIKGKQ
ncbi:MAG: acetate--CoA ligase [Deltaproteobacteria bacterium]|nr:acetate--CoA ligase [Deltaproteobacteria bacterium]